MFPRPRMGLWSGYAGVRGERVRPVELNANQAPSEEELGIAEPGESGEEWPLHVKRVGTIDVEKVLSIDTPFKELTREAFRWLLTADYYGEPITSVRETKFSDEDWEKLCQFAKVEPHEGTVWGYVAGFWVREVAKRRRRPIFEPGLNRCCNEERLPTLEYPSRLERRTRARNKYVRNFDCAAYFDQFAIPQHLRGYFVFQHKGALYHLTRMPMGARFAPAVAQYCTWTLAAEVIKDFPELVIDTMIDNLRLAANDKGTLDAAARRLEEVAATLGITLNPGQDDSRESEFLGEMYIVDEHRGVTAVRNTGRTVDKVTRAAQHVTAGKPTKRNFMALVSLLCYALHTVGESPVHVPALLRCASAVAASIVHSSGWEEPMGFVGESVRGDILRVAALLRRNEPREIHELIRPGARHGEYDATIFVDACRTGWGALILFADETVELREGWSTSIPSSAFAEPYGAARAVKFAMSRLQAGAKVALVTDHTPICIAQRKWYSAWGGVGRGTALNQMFQGLAPYDVAVWYIAGEKNPADTASRATTIGMPMSIRRVNLILPPLEECYHPYREKRREFIVG